MIGKVYLKDQEAPKKKKKKKYKKRKKLTHEEAVEKTKQRYHHKHWKGMRYGTEIEQKKLSGKVMISHISDEIETKK